MGLDLRPIAHSISIKDASAGHAAQQRFDLMAYTCVAAILILAALGLYWCIKRKRQPPNDAVATVSALAKGDLDAPFPA